jgi:hypothetical protein
MTSLYTLLAITKNTNYSSLPAQNKLTYQHHKLYYNFSEMEIDLHTPLFKAINKTLMKDFCDDCVQLIAIFYRNLAFRNSRVSKPWSLSVKQVMEEFCWTS